MTEGNKVSVVRNNGQLRHPRILALASGGGHWVQLLRLRSAWDGCDVAYATTHVDYENDIRGDDASDTARFYTFPDANLDRKLRLIPQLFAVTWIVLRERPDVVISTGASAGYFALRVAKLLRCRTVWLDSIANVDGLSVSGREVARFADLWLTQWPDLARLPRSTESRLRYLGSVL